MTEIEMIQQAGIKDEDVYEYRRQKEIKQRKVSNEMRAADTLINAAGYDSLKPETDEFVAMLLERGTHVEYAVYPEAEHGFTHADLREYREDDANDAWDHIARFIAAR